METQIFFNGTARNKYTLVHIVIRYVNVILAFNFILVSILNKKRKTT